MSPEYSVEGKFPDSKRIFGTGIKIPKMSHLTTNQIKRGEKNLGWTGALEVNGEEVKGKLVFERNADGVAFFSENELLDYLANLYSITYCRDLSKPAVVSGG
ncbi:MAG: hypothetical protein ABII80_02820 [bacterium]